MVFNIRDLPRREPGKRCPRESKSSDQAWVLDTQRSIMYIKRQGCWKTKNNFPTFLHSKRTSKCILLKPNQYFWCLGLKNRPKFVEKSCQTAFGVHLGFRNASRTDFLGSSPQLLEPKLIQNWSKINQKSKKYRFRNQL